MSRHGDKVRTVPGSESFTYEEALKAVLASFNAPVAPAVPDLDKETLRASCC